jgi:hypothetical protein
MSKDIYRKIGAFFKISEDRLPSQSKYQKRFRAAYRRTQRLDLEPGFRFTSNTSLLDLDAREKIIDQTCEVLRMFFDGDYRDTKFQCFKATIELGVNLQQSGIEHAITLGSVYRTGNTLELLFGVSTIDAESALKTSSYKSLKEMHAWITLPSMHIVDMTLEASDIAISKNQDRKPGLIVSAPEAIKGFRYFPQFLGENFVRKTGLSRL